MDPPPSLNRVVAKLINYINKGKERLKCIQTLEEDEEIIHLFLAIIFSHLDSYLGNE